MRLISLALLLFAFAACAPAAGGPENAAAFPRSWYGTWEGELVVARAGGGEERLPMTFSVGPAERAGCHEWRIRYGEQPERRYLLVEDDPGAGRWVIDERNSIRIPAVLMGGELLSEFSVSGNRVAASYRLEGEALHLRITMAPDTPTGATGGEGVPRVDTYDVRTLQRAVLRREAD